MAAEPRIQMIMDLIEQVFEHLEGIRKSMEESIETESAKETPDPHKVAFYNSQISRVERLTDFLEEDVLTELIGLSNISGPIKYLQDEDL